MFEGLLKDQIRGNPDIAGMLASYKNKPAFFFQKAPLDTDTGWEKGSFPRMDYNVNSRYDPERKVSGTLDINIWCSTESAFMPEEIDAKLVKLVSGTFYIWDAWACSGGTQLQAVGIRDTICAVWNRSDAFAFEMPSNIKNNTVPEVFGITTVFDLLKFPEQLTTDPDPIESLNHWTRANFPEMTVINLDAPPPAGLRPSVWKPSDEHPAIYWRFEGTVANERQSYAVTWYDGSFAAHIIADTVAGRNRWTKAIIERLQMYGEVMMIDGSPMFVKQISVRHSADPLREGQLVITGQYGVLEQNRKERAEIPLNIAAFKKEPLAAPYLRLEVNAYDRYEL